MDKTKVFAPFRCVASFQTEEERQKALQDPFEEDGEP